MPDDEKMSIDERRKYLKLVSSRYAKAGRRERGELLTEMGEVTGLHRKSLTRLMNMPRLRRKPPRYPGPFFLWYDFGVIPVACL